MRILVTGRDGQLGLSIKKIVETGEICEDEFIFVGRQELDLSDNKNVEQYFESNNRFDAIINCAAYTAVDRAEEEQELANQVNHLAVSQLAVIANRYQARLIHISTDYVFDGNNSKPYSEKNIANPVNVYGISKLAGEGAILKNMPSKAVIIRTSWLYSEFGNNFVKTMLRLCVDRGELGVVSDQVGSPTYALDLASVVLRILRSKKFIEENKATQIYHYSNNGAVNWYEFAEEIFKISKIKCNVSAIKTEQYPAQAKRPMNTLMSKSKIKREFNVNIPSWRESLRTCIFQLKKMGITRDLQ